MINGLNYIGEEVSAKGDTVFSTFNPQRNLETGWKFHEATDSEIDEAVSLASKAFNTYKDFSGKRKAEFLRAIAEEIEALGDSVIDVYMQESGLPEGRAKGRKRSDHGAIEGFCNPIGRRVMGRSDH